MKFPEKIFLIFALFFGIVFLFLTPPFEVADESSHFYKSFEISEFKNFGISVNGTNGDYLPQSLRITTTELMGTVAHHPTQKFDIEKLGYFLNYPLNPDIKEFYSSLSILSFYSPIAYFPQAAGILIGKLLNCSPLVLMYLGRICNFFLWVCLGYYAIKITPIGKWLFLFLALTPMSLFQAASLSQDAFINGTAFLLISLFLFYALSNDKNLITNKDMAILIFISLLLSVSKQIYSFIPLMFLIIPINKFSNRKDFILKFCLLMFSIFLINIFWLILTKGLLTTVISDLGLDMNAQLLFIFNNPTSYLLIFINTLVARKVFYITSFIGNLGWLDTNLTGEIYILFPIILLFLAIFDSQKEISLTRKQKCVFGLIIVPIFFMIFTMEYLIWTPLGAKFIEGPSGRYFIPISPLLFLLFYNNLIILNEKLTTYAKIILIALLSYILFRTTQVIFLRYYPSAIPLTLVLVLFTIISILQISIFYFIETKAERENRKYTPQKLSNKAITLLSILIILITFSIILFEVVGTYGTLKISQPIVNQTVGEITENLTVGQSFYSTSQNLKSIDILMATHARINTKDIIFHLKSSPEDLNDIILIKTNAALIEDNGYHRFEFSPIKESANKSYYVYIESPDSVPGNAITIWSSHEDVYPQGSEYLNSKPINKDLTFNVYYASILPQVIFR